MDVAYRLRQLREWRNLSQGDIEKRTGLLRCYISRAENGHTVPSIATLEKMSRALEVSMYQFFFDADDATGEERSSSNGIPDWASVGRGQRVLKQFRNALSQMSEKDRAVLLFTAGKMTGKKRRRRVG